MLPSQDQVRETLEYHLLTEIARTLGYHGHRLHLEREQERYTGQIIRDCNLVAYEPQRHRVLLGLDLAAGTIEFYYRVFVSGHYTATEENHVLGFLELGNPGSLDRETLRRAVRRARHYPSVTIADPTDHPM